MARLPVNICWLTPISPYLPYLPCDGMSEDDFQLPLDTLNLWKKKIVQAKPPEKADLRDADID